MKLRQELLAMIGALLALNLLMAVAAVGLLSRMSPVTETILQENAYSMRAAEDVLIELARLGDEPSEPGDRMRVLKALERASNNITEPEERPAITAIQTQIEAALAGNRDARLQVVKQLEVLLSINRDAMERVDTHAQHLGRSGAWAVVIIGVLFFAMSLAVLGRLQRRFLDPLIELHDTLMAAGHGDPWRRCRKLDAPVELNEVAATINHLLDERLREQSQT